VSGLAVCAALALLTAAQSAAADEPPITRDQMEADMLSYYGGERLSAYVVLGLSAASVGGGAYLVTRKDDFSRGLGWPLLTVGAIEAIGAVSYAFTVGAEIEHYQELLAKDPAQFQKEEQPHIHGTTSRFIYYRITEVSITLAGAGLGTYGFAANKDVFKGVGVGLFAIGLPLVIIDTINNDRAGTYEDHVTRFTPSVTVQPVAGGGVLSLVGRL
jgi:hypothetical protein